MYYFHKTILFIESEKREKTMEKVRTEVSATIDAPPAEVYAVFADYRGSHPQVLPKPYFGDLVVEKGGTGAGTVFRTSLTVMGKTIDYYMQVTEPEPGRVLMEKDEKLGVETSFIIDPLDAGKRSRVTIATDWTPSKGIMGWLEKMTTPRLMRQLYETELNNVQEYLKKRKAGGGGGFK
jgi:hypothetical protein